jgi:hypothetical protein
MCQLYVQSKQQQIWNAACIKVLNRPAWKPKNYRKAIKGDPALLRKLGLLFARLAEIILSQMVTGGTPSPVDIEALVKASISDEFSPYDIAWGDLSVDDFELAWKRHHKLVTAHLGVLVRAGLLLKTAKNYSLTDAGLNLANELCDRIIVTDIHGWLEENLAPSIIHFVGHGVLSIESEAELTTWNESPIMGSLDNALRDARDVLRRFNAKNTVCLLN